jgi:hypothetical protein
LCAMSFGEEKMPLETASMLLTGPSNGNSTARRRSRR